MNQQAIAVRRGRLGRYPRRKGQALAIRKLPEYLEAKDVNALIALANPPQAALLMLLQWRAGLRVSEALALEAKDLHLEGEHPTLTVCRGKGSKPRMVPVHPELRAALLMVMSVTKVEGSFIKAHPATAWRWVRQAVKRAEALGQLRPGRKIGTHTFRHSAARHWLEDGIPLNLVSVWLGHASIQTTLIYLQLLPDAMGRMERVT
jgi:integrase/recombinase XerD